METEEQFLQFEETGCLKAGVHECTLETLQKLTFTNLHRQYLGGRLLNFLRWPLGLGTFEQVYIGGGFISNSPFPQDIDLVLEPKYPYGPAAFAALEPFFAKGLDNILNDYSVHLHFWVQGAPIAIVDFRSFFQYQRPGKNNCFDLKKRGIVTLSLSSQDFSVGLDLLCCTEWSHKCGEIMVAPVRPQSMAA
jgi:hypothetical protein